MNHARHAIGLLATLAAVLLGGCGSPWQTAYEGLGTGAYPTTDTVEIREVPWQRLAPTLERIESERAASDTHFSEWPADKREAERRELLSALQVSEDPARVEILGQSLFRTTEPLRASDNRLTKFAAKLGADLVIVSNVYTGKADRVVHETVWTEGWRTVPYRDDHGHRKYRDESYSESVNVPVVVQADEHAWAAYFIRRD